MIGCGSILDVKPYYGQNGSTCSNCGGHGWLKRYSNKQTWYGRNSPTPIIENFKCDKCDGYGYINVSCGIFK